MALREIEDLKLSLDTSGKWGARLRLRAVVAGRKVAVAPLGADPFAIYFAIRAAQRASAATPSS